MKSGTMWIYQALLCVLLSVDVECRKQTLQRAFYVDHINRKCHLLPFDRFSDGAKRERKPNYDLYEKKDYVKECIIGSGVNYKARRSFTKTGITCQAWNMSIPHEHNFKPARHKKFDLRQNFCRNPDNDPSGPWCFTELTETRHQECGLPQCSEDSDNDVEVEVTTSCFRGQGEGYRGTVNVTPAGVTCQRWDALFPHNHSYTPHNYKCKDLRENFCRNPDGSEIPWCFTTDPKVRKAFCTNIPRCDSESSDSTECYEDNGESYRGNLSKTRSGIPCGLWSDHTFRRGLQSAKASAGLELNLCRNPDRDKHGPWCYTSNSSIPWDYCGLERCKSVSLDDHQKTGGGPKPSCFIHKTTRIVGGMQVQRAEDGSWVVSIQKGVPDLSEYTVQVGLLHLNASTGTQGLRIAHVVCGPEGSNLALLKLTTPAPLSEHVRTVLLPVAGCAVAEGTYCLMYGWGDTKGTGHEGSLKMVGLPIVSNKRCSQSHKGILPITETKICAGGKRDQGVCEKDYGGPLVCQEGESKVIVGVSINGRGCAVTRRPAVFVNVAFYSEWIRKVFKYYSDLEISY
ncbi:hypothetical protein cypCar_00004744 [Cyprinus carpio]|nr:hypothetical protein cypCar_00004744 [Cyprinus carpio]